MKIGVPKEVKEHEYRVGLTPSSVKEIKRTGACVFVETQAGSSIGFSDEDYQQAGAEIVIDVQKIFNSSDLIIKVKEPQKEEISLLHPNQILFTFLHLAANQSLTEALLKKNIIGIAYETVTDAKGGLPLLTPMSEIAGRLSIQVGARFLEKTQEGAGILLSGVPGIEKGEVVIIGGGVVGKNAAQIALGMGANVTILDKSLSRLQELENIFKDSLQTLYSTETSLEKSLTKADLIIGSVLIPGFSTPKLITKSHLKIMKKRAVFVDVAIDQGGCSETSKPTTHNSPIYIEEEILHYCVTNMPSAVAKTATEALNEATLPFILEITSKGIKKALAENPHLRAGLNVWKGSLTCKAVADSFIFESTPHRAIGL